jgi:hypothetical protein
MGNQICTDQRPYSLDDIRRTKEDFPSRKALCQQSPLILRSTQQAFDTFEHNVKAFAFQLASDVTQQHIRDNVPSAAGSGAAVVSRRSNVVSHPVSLRDKVTVDPSCAYILLHIKRTDMKQLVPSSRTPPTDTSSVPEWASESFAAFTPRGLGTPFGIDIAAVRWRERNANEQYKFEYSLHVYNGRSSHQLVVAVATMQAFQLEKLLMSDVEVLQRLFYGFNASKPSELSLPVTVGALDFSDPRIDMALHRSRGPLHTVLQHHALLRNLFSVCLDLSPLTPRSSATATQQPTTRATRDSSASAVSADQNDPHTSETTATIRSPPVAATSPIVGFKLKVPLTDLKAQLSAGDDDTPEPPVNRRSPQLSPRQATGHQGTPTVPPPRLNLTGIKSLSLAAGASGAGAPPLTSSRRMSEDAPPQDLASTLTFASLPSTTSQFDAPPVSSRRRADNSDEQQDDRNAADDGNRPTLDDDANDEVNDTINKIRKLKEQSPVATEVLPYLFVGGEEAAVDRQQLIEKGITHIVNAAAHSIPNKFVDVVAYTSLYLCDSPDEPLLSLIPLVNRIIEATRLAGGKTFIHCHQGVSRSCSLVIGYIMWKMGLCYDEAYAFVRERRKVCSPNSGFYVNLLRWEKQLTSPPQQQCWAFLPFSKEYTFPFILRPVAAPTPAPASPGGQVPQVTLDLRCTYGLLTPSSEADGEGTVYLLRGTECPATYAQAAYVELEHYLKYGFFTGPTPKTSLTSRGISVTYTPTTFLRRRIVEMSSDNPKARGIASLSLEHHPRVSFLLDPELNALLQNDLPQLLDQHMDEQHQSEGLASARKRARAESLLRTAGSPGDDQKKSSAASASVPSLRLDASPKVAWSTADSSNEIENGGDEAIRQPSSSPGAALLVDGEDSEPEEGTPSLQIFEYPFLTSKAQEDIIDIDDLLTDKGYAIVVRGYRGAGVAPQLRKPHGVYLWLGEEFTKDEDALRTAFVQSATSGPLSSRRVTNRTRLADIEGEIVYEREEPSELLLAFA